MMSGYDVSFNRFENEKAALCCKIEENLWDVLTMSEIEELCEAVVDEYTKDSNSYLAKARRLHKANRQLSGIFGRIRLYIIKKHAMKVISKAKES